VDERTGQTGQALGTNQIIEPRDFVDVVTVEANDERWVKLVIWGIEHSDHYGANTRIYGEVHNTVLGTVEDTRLRLAAIDLARNKNIEEVKNAISERKLTLKAITCDDSEIQKLIEDLTKSPEVEDLARRKNRVDLSVPDYFKMVAEKWDKTLLEKEVKVDGKRSLKWDKWNTDLRLSQLQAEGLTPEAREAITQGLKLPPPENPPKDWQASDEDRLKFLKTQFGLARIIESAVSQTEAEEEEEVATK
jgi:hypothetical protein